MNDNLIMKVGFLKPSTSTVDLGNHFEKVKNLMNEFVDEEWSESIYCNKWLLTKMLELESSWNTDSKQIYTLLHMQLTNNIKSNI